MLVARLSNVMMCIQPASPGSQVTEFRAANERGVAPSRSTLVAASHKDPRSDGPGPSPAHKRDYDWQFPEDHMGTKEPVATGSEEPASSKSKCEPRLEGMNDDL